MTKVDGGWGSTYSQPRGQWMVCSVIRMWDAWRNTIVEVGAWGYLYSGIRQSHNINIIILAAAVF